jgi:hypothetical protein
LLFVAVDRGGRACKTRPQAEKEEPQPQVDLVFGLTNLKPAPAVLST